MPLFGVGPYMIAGMGALSLAGILLSGNLLKSGIITGTWAVVLHVVGGILIAVGLVIWYIGAARSDMDDHIADNKLKTDGIYAWLRNPMYTGWWFLLNGITSQWHNAWLFLLILIHWVLMTIVMKNTEEKWLKKLFGRSYVDYCKKVNRFIPWFPKKY